MKKMMAAILMVSMAVPAVAQDTLEQVLRSGELRVCSAGDYKPFSFEQNGQFEGLDNDLVARLAKSLNAQVKMVKTSWSNLMPDFTAGKCDLAIGGISITLPRQQQALFSEPYFTNGKTPLVRCEDVAKYQTVAQINRPEVRIIANPGGSNENYAKTVLTQASLTMHPENLTIFQEIIDKRADVFVTEAAEAIVKSREHAGVLCGVNPDKPLKPAQNAWLIHKHDQRFKDYVNQFFHLERLSGDLDKTIHKWLPR